MTLMHALHVIHIRITKTSFSLFLKSQPSQYMLYQEQIIADRSLYLQLCTYSHASFSDVQCLRHIIWSTYMRSLFMCNTI